jgi:hypothetical protein
MATNGTTVYTGSAVAVVDVVRSLGSGWCSALQCSSLARGSGGVSRLDCRAVGRVI